MTAFFYLAAIVLLTLLVAALFVRLDATRMAGALRIAGPVGLATVGAALLLFGRAALGGMLISGALAWFASARARRNARRSPGTRSTVRTAALEMELDHDTGALKGHVLVGRYEGRDLDALALEDLLDLSSELASDGESLQLLEAYLDSRFPVWRDHVKADAGQRQGGTPASGPMTKQEAYQILGLEAGASAAEVRKAHRRLMQRLHPDLGGSSFLAARINEAKDILLADHD